MLSIKIGLAVLFGLILPRTTLLIMWWFTSIKWRTDVIVNVLMFILAPFSLIYITLINNFAAWNMFTYLGLALAIFVDFMEFFSTSNTK